MAVADVDLFDITSSADLSASWLLFIQGRRGAEGAKRKQGRRGKKVKGPLWGRETELADRRRGQTGDKGVEAAKL